MKIGIIGSGQMARLLISENTENKYSFAVLAEKDIANLKELCEFHAYDSNKPSMLIDFIQSCDVVTVESEFLSADVLRMLQESPVVDKIYPRPKDIAQFTDKVKEKDYFRFMRVPTNEYRAVHSKDHALMLAETLTFPIYLKSREGSNQKGIKQLFTHLDDLNNAPETLFDHAILEEKVTFQNELSITGCRDKFGKTAFYDLSLTITENGSLHTSKNISKHPLFETAKNYLQRILTGSNYIGVCTIKFFEVEGQLIANQLSPGPHESANWTIDATTCNQFINHLRVISGKQLGHIQSFTDATILNLISSHPDNALPSFIKYYDYKTTSKNSSRLGHLTVVRSSFKSADEYHNAVNYLTKNFGLENRKAVND